MIGLLEAISCGLMALNFYLIPLIIDEFFLILALQIGLAGIVCLIQVKDEWKYNQNMKSSKNGDEDKSTLLSK